MLVVLSVVDASDESVEAKPLLIFIEELGNIDVSVVSDRVDDNVDRELEMLLLVVVSTSVKNPVLV